MSSPNTTIQRHINSGPSGDVNNLPKVLPDLAAQLAAAQAKIAVMEAEAQARRNKGLVVKMGQKGNVSVYGLGRYPVTLYAGQWERLIAHAPTVTKFLTDHASELSRKPTTE